MPTPAPETGSRPSRPTAALRHALETIRWGERFRDRALIASYYGLLVSAQGLRPRRSELREMHPKFWLADVTATTPIGRFRCRGGTTDFDIVNPHYESALVHEIGERLSKAGSRPYAFVDVGAHIGKYTIHAGRILRRRGSVIAVEPDRDNYAALQANLLLNGLDNVLTHNVGCWDSEGVRDLHRRRGNLGAHSFVNGVGGEALPAPMRTLDNLLREDEVHRVEILKVDVERAEEHVFRGAARLLSQSPPPTVFFEELGDPDTAGSVRYLRELGFSVRPLEGVTYIAEKLK